MPLVVFDGRDQAHGDEAYLDWTTTHRDAWLLNTWRNIDPDYLALHRPSCDFVTNEERYEPGAYTERDLIKVCADTLEELREWVRVRARPDGLFTHEGCRCLHGA